jgi:hypothetical protein
MATIKKHGLNFRVTYRGELKVETVDVIEGNLYQRSGECGYIAVCDCIIQAVVEGGKVYRLKHVFIGVEQSPDGFDFPVNSKAEAEDVLYKIIDRGSINPKHWDYVGTVEELEAATPSLEQRLHEEWIREDMERKGYRY